MAGIGKKWLEMAGMAGHCWKWLDMARNCWNGRIWLKIFRNCWKLLEMAGNGLTCDGLITVLWICGLWYMKTGGLGIGGFPIGSRKIRFPGLFFYCFGSAL